MQQKVAEYVANLLMAGVPRDRVAELGYRYALSLQSDEQPSDGNHLRWTQARFMFKASEIIRDAMPQADKIHHERCMVKPIAPTIAQIRKQVGPTTVERAFRESEGEV